MKKALSIFFLFIFLYNLAGYFVVFSLEQFSAREEMESYIKNHINESLLEKIIVPNSDIITGSSDFRYKDNNSEFVFKGKLYDIVRQKSDGSNIIFYCINDKNEECLIQGLEDHIQRNSDQNLPAKNNTSNLVKNIVKDALPDNPQKQIDNFCAKISIYSFHNFALKEQFILPQTPPPKS